MTAPSLDTHAATPPTDVPLSTRSGDADRSRHAQWIAVAWMTAHALMATPAFAQTERSPQPASTEVPASPPKRTRVKEVRVTGNTLLPVSDIDAALARLLGERSMADLEQAALAVQALYSRAGYGAVLVYMAPQSMDDGIVTITVLEGRISRTPVSGNKQFSDANIRAAVPALRLGETPRVDVLDVQVEMANENPSRQIQLTLEPGQATGEVEGKLMVTEAPVQRWSIDVDNRGNARTGRLRSSLGWQHANMWDRDQVLSAQVQTSPDNPSAVQVFSGNYRLPLYEPRVAVDLYAAYSNVRPGAVPTLAGDLQFNGRGRVFGAKATRYLPRLGEFDQRVGMSLDSRDYLNDCTVVGLPPGACGPAGENISVQPLSIDYLLQRSGARSMWMTASLVHNLQLGGTSSTDSSFGNARFGSKPRFSLLRLTTGASAAISSAMVFSVRAVAQWTADALISSEQFGVGGATSVRGYEERELAGDRGGFASMELSSVDIAKPLGLDHSKLRVLSFIDIGWAGNRLGTPCLGNNDSCAIASAGAGLRYGVERLQMQLLVARALKTAAQTQRNDFKLHTTVSYEF